MEDREEQKRKKLQNKSNQSTLNVDQRPRLQQRDTVFEFCELVHGIVETMPLIKQGKMMRLELLAGDNHTDEKWAPNKKNA